MKRVVVTGMAGLSGIGDDLKTSLDALRSGRSGIKYIPEWDEYTGLKTRVAGRIDDFKIPEHYDRKKIRAMGRVALLATRATELALSDADLLDSAILGSDEMGVAYGSATGSPEAISYFGPLWFDKTMKGISATTYMQMMPHTCAANISVFFGISGRIIPTCSACSSGSQGIGFGYETIRSGHQKLMVVGGAEELCVTVAAVFDSMYAASTRNDNPQEASRPFSADREGVVISEGAATLILEELEHAKARGARIYAEVAGFASNTDGMHLSKPHAERMERCIRLSLANAELGPEAIGYVNAHATATKAGDIAEAQATARVFGDSIPISSVKGHLGHTLGACGALEAWLAIEMQRINWFAPTLNLNEVDPECPTLDYITGDGRELKAEYIISNNFAFGGTNTSLIFKRWEDGI